MSTPRPVADPVPPSRPVEVPEVRRAAFSSIERRGGQLVAARRDLTVVDHGTGLGDEVVRLGVDRAEASDLVRRSGLEPIVLPERELHLVPAPGDDSLVEVDEPGRPPGRRRVRVRRARVADHLLARFTHERLGPEEGSSSIHAGVVVAPDGQAALILGSSGSGKSTLVTHLVHAGFDLLNDEQVRIFDEEAVVGGFTRPVALKRSGVRHLPSTLRSGIAEGETGALVTAAELGGRHALTGTPALVVLPERFAGAAQVQWEDLGPSQVVEACCLNNLDLVAGPVAGLRSYAWLAATASGIRLHYGDVETAAEAVGARITASGRSPSLPWSVVEAMTPEPGTLGPTAGVATVTVGSGPDLEAVLYHGGTRAVLRLNAAGAAVWRALPHRTGSVADEALLTQLAALGFVVKEHG